jgi:cAMP-dependent protein kinase regulator
MADAPIELLEQIPLFEGLPHQELERIARSFKQRRFSAGDTVAAEGSGGVGFFVIGEGTATVDVHGEQRGQLGPGDYFGETVVLDAAHRTASVRARTSGELIEMDAATFRDVIEGSPESVEDLRRIALGRAARTEALEDV